MSMLLDALKKAAMEKKERDKFDANMPRAKYKAEQTQNTASKVSEPENTKSLADSVENNNDANFHSETDTVEHSDQGLSEHILEEEFDAEKFAHNTRDSDRHDEITPLAEKGRRPEDDKNEFVDVSEELDFSNVDIDSLGAEDNEAHLDLSAPQDGLSHTENAFDEESLSLEALNPSSDREQLPLEENHNDKDEDVSAEEAEQIRLMEEAANTTAEPQAESSSAPMTLSADDLMAEIVADALAQTAEVEATAVEHDRERDAENKKAVANLIDVSHRAQKLRSKRLTISVSLLVFLSVSLAGTYYFFLADSSDSFLSQEMLAQGYMAGRGNPDSLNDEDVDGALSELDDEATRNEGIPETEIPVNPAEENQTLSDEAKVLSLATVSPDTPKDNILKEVSNITPKQSSKVKTVSSTPLHTRLEKNKISKSDSVKKTHSDGAGKTSSAPTLDIHRAQNSLSDENDDALLADSLLKSRAEREIRERIMSSVSSELSAMPAQEKIHAGYRAYSFGQYAKAYDYYFSALADVPENRDALLGAAAVSVRKGALDVALRLYQSLLVIHSDDALAKAGVLSLSTAFGDFDALLNETKYLLREHPQDAHLYFLMGSIFSMQESWSAAQAAFEQAESKHQFNPDYAFNLAVASDHLGEMALAIRYYLRAKMLSKMTQASFSHLDLERRIQDIRARQE